MEHKAKIVIVISLCLFNLTSGQEAVTLKKCYQMAEKSSALAGEKDAYSTISKYKTDNIRKNWLPSIDAGGTIVYNSEVVDMSSVLGALPIPGLTIDPLPHEQYKVTVDINQVIYDGGMVKNSKAVEAADLKVNQQLTEADMYKTKSQINSTFFNIILLNRQKELLTNFREVIEKRLRSMESAYKNGVILRSDLDVLTSESIRLEQQIRDAEIKKLALISVLSDLTGEKIDAGAAFIIPETSLPGDTVLRRPELKVFDLRIEQLSAGSELAESKRLPKAFGFATLGYGNPPGSNFFRDEFAPYYIIGAGIKWNIWDWGKVKNEKQLFRVQQDILEKRKSDLSDTFNRSLMIKLAEIRSIEESMARDNELIELRKRITSSAESQYSNGTITATELLNEMNSEKQAEINAEIHKISLALARVEYLNIKGVEIE